MTTATPEKPAAKKAAKNDPGNDPNKARKDTRRAYEHLGRVQTLLQLLDGEDAARVQQLLPLAQGALQAGQPKESADLLRCAEHLSFGSLRLSEGPDETVSADLKAAVEDEIDHQQQKSQEHGEAEKSPEAIQSLYRYLSQNSEKALKGKRYRAALEFARGAEALSHLDHLSTHALPSGGAAKKLSA